MKYVKIFYNCSLWAMAAALTCFNHTWLQMRVNTGYIFYGGWLVSAILLSLLLRNKRCQMNWLFTAVNLGICMAYELILYGSKRLKIVPASLLREGIHQTRIRFSTINKVIFIYLVLGFIIILVTDIWKKRRQSVLK